MTSQVSETESGERRTGIERGREREWGERPAERVSEQERMQGERMQGERMQGERMQRERKEVWRKGDGGGKRATRTGKIKIKNKIKNKKRDTKSSWRAYLRTRRCTSAALRIMLGLFFFFGTRNKE